VPRLSLPGRRAKRRDANESDIIKALEQVGATVTCLDTPCDLLVSISPSHGFGLMEVKDGDRPPSQRTLTASQERFFLHHPQYPVAKVESVEEALEALEYWRKRW